MSAGIKNVHGHMDLSFDIFFMFFMEIFRVGGQNFFASNIGLL
jgi:hypothetical protein